MLHEQNYEEGHNENLEESEIKNNGSQEENNVEAQEGNTKNCNSVNIADESNGLEQLEVESKHDATGDVTLDYEYSLAQDTSQEDSILQQKDAKLSDSASKDEEMETEPYVEDAIKEKELEVDEPEVVKEPELAEESVPAKLPEPVNEPPVRRSTRNRR